MPRVKKADRHRSAPSEDQLICCCHGSGCHLAEQRETKRGSSSYDIVDPKKAPVHVKSDQIESVRLTMSAEPVCVEEATDENTEKPEKKERKEKKKRERKQKRRKVERSTIKNTNEGEERDYSQAESSRYENEDRVKTEDLQVVAVSKSEKKKKKKKKTKKQSKRSEESEELSALQSKDREDSENDANDSSDSHRKPEVHSLWSLLTGPERKYINEIPRRLPSASSVYEMVASVNEMLFSERDRDFTSASRVHDESMDKEASDLIGDRIGQFYLGAVKKEDAEKHCRRRMKFRFYHRMPGKDFIYDYNLMPARLMLWMVYRTRKGDHRHFAIQKHHGQWTVVNEPNKKFSYFNNLIRYYTGHPGDLENGE